jgi:hypothetical protein
MEHRNLVYRNMDVRHALRLSGHVPNQEGAGYNYSFVPHPGDADRSLEWLRPVCVNLAMVFFQQKRHADLARLVPFLNLLNLSGEDRKLLAEHAGLDGATLL